jgi:hypothetical protein
VADGGRFGADGTHRTWERRAGQGRAGQFFPPTEPAVAGHVREREVPVSFDVPRLPDSLQAPPLRRAPTFPQNLHVPPTLAKKAFHSMRSPVPTC